MSTWLPGKKATIPPNSTANPPFTLPIIIPSTVASCLWSSSNFFHASFLIAFSRLSMVLPPLPSNLSTNTSTSSPTDILVLPPAKANSLNGMRPSLFRPTSTITASLSTATTFPLAICPSCFSFFTYSAKRVAKSSVIFKVLSIFLCWFVLIRVFVSIYYNRVIIDDWRYRSSYIV